MRNILKKISVFLLIFAIFASFSVSVFASESFVEWNMSDAFEKLTRDDGRVYYLVDEPGVFLYAFEVYGFVDVTYYGPVYATHADSEIVWVESGRGISFYATEIGYEHVLDVLEGNVEKYRLRSVANYNTDFLTDGFVKALDEYEKADGAARAIFDVRDLEYAARYDVVATDYTETIGLVHGAIYFIGDSVYYLNYSELSNQYFDADGNFSYRRGEVALTELDGALLELVTEALYNMQYFDVRYTWEDSGYDFGTVQYTEWNLLVFWICYSIIGFAAPSIFIVISLVLANRRNRRAKYWCVVSAVAGAWLLISIALALMLVLL